MRDHSVVIKPKRQRGVGAVVLLVLLLVLSIAGLGAGFFAPASLSLAQEQVLGLLHGGIVATDEQTFVDACVSVAGMQGPQAVTRTIRTTTFRDGTTLTVAFTSRPTPTITQC
ncbi:MAG: hypothetical protein DIU80_001805 [Chloroflexota bacterium]